MTQHQPLPQLGQWDTIDELLDLQRKQLPQLLDWATRSPFYRARHGDTPIDPANFSSLPLTS